MGFLEWFREALAGGDRTETVHSLLTRAHSHFERKNFDQARGLLLRALGYPEALSYRPFTAHILMSITASWLCRDRYDEAITFLSDFLGRYPDDGDAHKWRGAAHWYSGRHREAIDDYTRALTISPEDVGALSGRGQTFAELGEHARAAQDLDRALELLSENTDLDPQLRTSYTAYALNGRAAVLAAQGQFESALREFDASIALCPAMRGFTTTERKHTNCMGKHTKQCAITTLPWPKPNQRLASARRKTPRVDC
ncbi:MAG: tetratricopeptide repeat protein [Candidatus Acidiferrales bacterium]